MHHAQFRLRRLGGPSYFHGRLAGDQSEHFTGALQSLQDDAYLVQVLVGRIRASLSGGFSHVTPGPLQLRTEDLERRTLRFRVEGDGGTNRRNLIDEERVTLRRALEGTSLLGVFDTSIESLHDPGAQGFVFDQPQ